MSERTGILVFTLWYIAIAVAYYRGQLGGKSEDEKSLGDLTESQASLSNETAKEAGDDNDSTVDATVPTDDAVPATVAEVPNDDTEVQSTQEEAAKSLGIRPEADEAASEPPPPPDSPATVYADPPPPPPTPPHEDVEVSTQIEVGGKD